MAKLGDIATIQSGGTPARSIAEYWEDGTIPWVKISDIKSKHLNQTEEMITEAGLANSSAKIFPKGTILYTIFATLGETSILDINAATNQAIAGISITDSRVLPDYLYYYLLSQKIHVQKIGRGVAQNNINMKLLRDFDVPLPSKEAQLNIIEQLNRVTELLFLRKQQLTKLDELVKARFVEMFGDPKLNPYRFPCNSLSTYITFLTSGSRGWSQYFTDSGEYFITIKNVKNCKITIQDVQYVAPPDNAEAKRTKVQKNDLLISITADLGRTGVVTEEIANHGAYINQHLTCIRLKDEQVNPLYVAYYMESDAGKEQFTAKNQSAVKAGLNFNAINSLKLIAPPLSLQNQFADFVAEVDKSKLLAELFAQSTCILAENRSK